MCRTVHLLRIEQYYAQCGVVKRNLSNKSIRHLLHTVCTSMSSNVTSGLPDCFLREAGMIRQAFISHTGQDPGAATFAAQLSKDLHGIGISTFLDHRSLEGGDDWSELIEHNARHSQVMVVVLSESYFRRWWCMRELDLAVSAKKQGEQIVVIPVYYGISDLGDLITDQQQAWQEMWETFALAGKEGVGVQRWLDNLQWLKKHSQGIRRMDTSKNSEVQLGEAVVEAVFKVIPALLHEGFTVALDDSAAKVQELLLDSPVVAIVGAGEWIG
jgi:TIR domain